MACWGMNAFIFDAFNRTNRCSYFSLPNAHPNKIRNLNPDGQELLRLLKNILWPRLWLVARDNGGCVRQKGSFDGHMWDIILSTGLLSTIRSPTSVKSNVGLKSELSSTGTDKSDAKT